MKRIPFPLVLLAIVLLSQTVRSDLFPKPKEITPPGKYPVLETDYFTQYYGDACDFEEGDFERIAVFGPGIKQQEVKDGKLQFIATDNAAYFYFGRWEYPEGDTDIPDENIGVGWRRRYERVQLRMRVKQSKPASQWRIGVRSTRGAVGNVPGGSSSDTISISGTNWQEIAVGMPFARGWPNRAVCIEILPLASLDDSVQFGEEEKTGNGTLLEDILLQEVTGNRISIDSIRISNLTTPVFYRKHIHLDGDPVYGAFRVNLRTEHSIYVNGQQAQYYAGFLNRGDNPAVDITPYLHAGDNVIAVGATNTYWTHGDAFTPTRLTPYCQLICEGTALSDKGSLVSLASDESWKATFDREPGWQKPELDDSSWKTPDVAPPDKFLQLSHGPTHYVGPLRPGIEGDPIFSLDSGIKLPFALPSGYKIEYALSDAFTGEDIANGSLDKAAGPGTVEMHELAYKPAHAGVYDVALQLLDSQGKEKERHTLEAAVVGPIHQKLVKGDSFTEGMNLKLLLEIDCTKPDKPNAATAIDAPAAPDVKFGEEAQDTGDPLLNQLLAEDPDKKKRSRKVWDDYYLYTCYVGDGPIPPTQVAESPIGKYRVTDTKAWTTFGYMFSVSNMYRPHLVEVEYPDDKDRHIMAKIFTLSNTSALRAPEKHNWGLSWSYEQRWYSGVATGGGRFPPSNTFKKLYLIFWPDRDRDLNTIQIINEKQGSRAAARRIRIYEIDQIPALDLQETPGRMYGMFNEREYLAPETFYSGKYWKKHQTSPYTDWGEDRLGRLRDWYDACENMVKYFRFAGHNLYIPGYYMYTGTFFPETVGQSRSDAKRTATDHFRLMAAMFEQNGISLMLGTQYFTSWPPMEKATATNWEVIHEAKPSALGIAVDGRQSLYSGAAGSGAMNYLAEPVEDDLIILLDQYLRYSYDYKSVKGVFYYTASVGFPSVPVLHGLGGLPDSALGWELHNRAINGFESATGVDVPIPDDDLERYLKRYNYFNEHPDLLEKWIAFRCQGIHDQLVRIRDRALKTRPDWKIYINPTGPSPYEEKLYKEGEITYTEALRRRGYDFDLYKEDNIVNSMNAMVRRIAKTKERMEDVWNPKDSMFYIDRWPTPAHSQSVWPVDPYSAYDYMPCMAEAAPSILLFGKSDVRLITGGEQKMRPFIRTFRSLPVGRYTTLRGDAFDDGLSVRTLKNDEGSYFYIVNRRKTPANAQLTFSAAVELTDLGQQAAAGKGTKIQVSIDPYGMRAFRIEPADATITAANVPGRDDDG